MRIPAWLSRLRGWIPLPTRHRGVDLGRWVLLEGDRIAVTGALLTVTFTSILVVGEIWTFELAQLLIETPAMETILSSFLSGIILLVSIVVSINSIVLSYDITDVGAQRKRVSSSTDFRKELSRAAGTDHTPTDTASFLLAMSRVITARAEELSEAADGRDEEFADALANYATTVERTAGDLETALDQASRGEFGVLWVGLETDYGPLMNRMRDLTTTHRSDLSDDVTEQLEELMHILELFATGREYFKTLYYGREISELSRTLLFISLPSIIVTAWTILAINADAIPNIWLFGLPPILTFIGATFTIALAPFIVLTAYMLRVATVANRTASGGPFVVES